MAKEIWISVERSLQSWRTLRVFSKYEPGEFWVPETEEPFAEVVRNDAARDDDSPSVTLRHHNALKMDLDEFRRRCGRA